MRIPAISGIIDRRVLVNYRVDVDVLRPICPSPFRPQMIGEYGMAGICLIRLKHIRPKFLPAFFGISSENAAHRIAVEWDSVKGKQSGVYVVRRDTSSLLNAAAGGRVFPGVHNLAHFDVRESEKDYHIEMKSIDGSAHVLVDACTSATLPAKSIFPDLAACSRFFEDGAVGYSCGKSSGKFDGLELRAHEWRVQPLDVANVRSSFFENTDVFPAGSVTFDNALLMRGISHEWLSRESLSCSDCT